MKKYGLALIVIMSFFANTTYAHSQLEQEDSSPREKYDGVGENINYSDPTSNNYIAPPIFPFPDAYMLGLPQEITVEDVQIHPPILPYPHRMQYEVEQNLLGNSNR